MPSQILVDSLAHPILKTTYRLWVTHFSLSSLNEQIFLCLQIQHQPVLPG